MKTYFATAQARREELLPAFTEVELICEGRCNPSRERVDADVARRRRQEMPGRAEGCGIVALDGALVAELRTLVYTPHRSYGGRAVCLHCQTARVYGNDKAWAVGHESSVK